MIREKIEWLNYWIEDADDEEEKRILLIGDSVARGYRKALNFIMKEEGFVIDLLAMSHSIFDGAFIEAIENYIGAVEFHYNYHYVLFNLGAHHGYSATCRENIMVQREYGYRLKTALKILGKLSNDVITVAGTPENKKEAGVDNREIEVRNCILESVSKELGYKFIDIYNPFISQEFSMIDRYHYFDNEYEHMATIIKTSMGFKETDTEMKNANRIESLKLLMKILRSVGKVYLYGDGKRGRLLYKFLQHKNCMVRGFIVSDKFYKGEDKGQILLREVVEKIKKEDIIFVTPEERCLWGELSQLNLNYYTLGKRIYIYIEEYVDAYLDL